MRRGFLFCLLSVIFCIHPTVSFAQAIDEELANSLKIEANHNLNRLKSLKGERKNQKVFENEREKGLGSFLEDQEKWDLARERGLREYRKQKKDVSPKEDGPEHLADIKEKKRAADAMEKSRKIQVRTRSQIEQNNGGVIAGLEVEELGLNNPRPRYDLRKRGQNRWVKNSGPSSRPSPSSPGSSPGYVPPPPAFDDFPPPPAAEYNPPPSPMEGFEEIPPPPPPVYEGYGQPGGFDSGYGEIPPPPPPPPMDYDF